MTGVRHFLRLAKELKPMMVERKERILADGANGKRTGRRKISAAGRARIAAAQRARWAKVKGQSQKQGSPKKRASKATTYKKSRRTTNTKVEPMPEKL